MLSRRESYFEPSLCPSPLTCPIPFLRAPTLLRGAPGMPAFPGMTAAMSRAPHAPSRSKVHAGASRGRLFPRG